MIEILNLKLVILLEYRNTKIVFAKDYTPNWSEEVFVIKKVKSTVPQIYVISDRKSEENVGTFYENESQKAKQQEFRNEKVIKRKDSKLYVQWKGCNNSLNSWTNKKTYYKCMNISKN